MQDLNYKHLHYFWVVAQEGSITRAAQRLGVAVQTISGQLSLLERQLGKTLFKAQGRGLVLTDSGRLVQGYADQIFQLGDALLDALAHSESESGLRLRVGISDGIPKLLAYQLLEKLTRLPQGLRLICEEDEFDDLLADLALHRLDVVLTDRPAPAGGNLKLFSTQLGDFATGLYGAPDLYARHAGRFPGCVGEAPLLLPSRHHALRARIDRWLEAQTAPADALQASSPSRLRPRIVGEFEDSALLNTFGRGGLGLFPAPLALAQQIALQFDARPLGEMHGVSEQIYAIYNERRIRHPALELLCNDAAPGLPENVDIHGRP